MRRALSWLLGAALALAGCGERHAGTETGNPEIVVSARFMVWEYGTTQTWDLPFQVMGMGYSFARPDGLADSGKCWNRPGGTLVNMAAFEASPLPDTSLPDEGPWDHSVIILRAPEAPAGLPDTADIETWSSPRYAKFDRFSFGVFRMFLFEMPRGAEYRLHFNRESWESWRLQDTVQVTIDFDMERWTDTLDSFRRLTTRRDGRNAPYLLLSPTENAAAWNALKAGLPEAFYADSVSAR